MVILTFNLVNVLSQTWGSIGMNDENHLEKKEGNTDFAMLPSFFIIGNSANQGCD